MVGADVTISVFVLFGMVMLYLLIKHVVFEVYPAVTFYITLLFLLVFIISCIQVLIPLIRPVYEQLSVANHPLVKAFLMSFVTLASLEIVQSYLDSQDEAAISKILEIVMKCLLLVYWISYFQQMR